MPPFRNSHICGGAYFWLLRDVKKLSCSETELFKNHLISEHQTEAWGYVDSMTCGSPGKGVFRTPGEQPR